MCPCTSQGLLERPKRWRTPRRPTQKKRELHLGQPAIPCMMQVSRRGEFSSRDGASGAGDDTNADLAFDVDERATRDLGATHAQDDVLADAFAETDDVAGAELRPLPRGHLRRPDLDAHDD